MKNKFLLLVLIIMSLFVIACKDKENDDNTPPTESKVAINFMYPNTVQIDIQLKQDESTVTYTLTSKDKIDYFMKSFQDIGFYQCDLKEDLGEAKYIITIDDGFTKKKEIKIYDSFIYQTGRYFYCESGLEFIDNYNSNNVDKTSSDSGWLPFI